MDRVRRLFGWIVAAAVAAVAVIFGVVSHEIPGRAAVSTSGPAPASNGGTSPGPSGTGATNTGSTGTTGGTGNTGGGASVSAPVPTRQAPTAVSGGTGW